MALLQSHSLWQLDLLKILIANEPAPEMVTQSAHFHNGISATHLTLYNNEIMTAYDLTKIISNGSNPFFLAFLFLFLFSLWLQLLCPSRATVASRPEQVSLLRVIRCPLVWGPSNKESISDIG